MADFQRGHFIQRLLRDTAGHFDFQLAVGGEQQHSAFGAGQPNDGVHHLLQNDIQIERGVNCRADSLESQQALALSLLLAEFFLELLRPGL